MIVKKINRPDVKQLIEEQTFNNKIYRICDSYAPKLGFTNTSINITTKEIETDFEYNLERGLSYENGEIKSYFIKLYKNGSSFESAFTSDQLKYYDEIINEFETLISSGMSSFTNESLSVYNKFKCEFVKVNGGSHAI